MSHLNLDTLSALADGALSGGARAHAERHIAHCAACRVAVEALREQDARLARSLDHDPGEDYFAGFADRVAGRIAAHVPGDTTVEEPVGRRWWNAPRALAWAGTVAVIVVGAALVVVVARGPRENLAQRAARDAGVPESAPLAKLENAVGETLSSEAGEPLAGASEPATPGGLDRADRETPVDDLRESAPPVPADEAASRAPAGAAAGRAEPGSAYQVRRTAGGEDLPAGERRAPLAPERPAPPPAEVEDGVGVRVQKNATAQPARPQPLAPGSRVEEREQGASAEARRAPAVPPSTSGAEPKREPSPTQTIAAPGTDAAKRVPATRALGDTRATADRGLLCGEIRDDRGRPLSGAQVTLTDLGVGAITDRGGRFCVSAPVGIHSMMVMAIGFEPLRRGVTLSAETPQLVLTLRPVPTTDTPVALETRGARKPAALSSPTPAPVPASPRPAAEDAPAFGGTLADEQAASRSRLDPALAPFAGQPDTVRALALNAHRLGLEATRRGSAARFDAAAAEWEWVVRRTAGTAAESEARMRLAEARFNAWQAGPTPRRAQAATEALTAYIARAPAGSARNRAAEWLDRVKR
jgi:hypothetical protein